MISRVWKRTFYKLGCLLGIIVSVAGYIVGTALIGDYVFHNMEAGLVIGLVGFFALMIGKSAYNDSKREIECENDELMRQLRLDEIKKRADQI